jgi:hypothetical protein
MIMSMSKKIEEVPYKRKIRGLTEVERHVAFNTINYVPYRRVHFNKRGKRNNNLNKCLQLLEVRAWERKGDCVFKNADLAKLIGVSARQITTYIAQLEKQGFITTEYHDGIRHTPIIQRDPETLEMMVDDKGEKVVLTTLKKRLTFRIIRCHRIIAKNGYTVPAVKVNPNSRKNKPFRFDFRPPTETINFDAIPLNVFEYSRLNRPEVIQNSVLEKLGRSEEARIKAMKNCYAIGMGLEEGYKAGMIPSPLSLEEIETPNPFANLYDQYVSEQSDTHPLIYDFEVKDMYKQLKLKAEIGDKEGLDILGTQYYINTDIECLPDEQVMYFNKPELINKSDKNYIDKSDPDWQSRLYIKMLRQHG